MITAIIDNTVHFGNFFDNIGNENMFIEEVDIENLKDLEGIVEKNDKVFFKEFNWPSDSSKESNKYDYINEKTLDNFRSPKYDKLYKERNGSLFSMSKAQYRQYMQFCKAHHECMIDPETGLSRFGTIGGGIVVKYQINYNYEEMFPMTQFVKCEYCQEENQLEETSYKDIEIDEEELDKKYASYINYGTKMTEVEFYRFIEIYNEYKETLQVNFMGTGLGYIITVKTKDFIFGITDYECW